MNTIEETKKWINDFGSDELKALAKSHTQLLDNFPLKAARYHEQLGIILVADDDNSKSAPEERKPKRIRIKDDIPFGNWYTGYEGQEFVVASIGNTAYVIDGERVVYFVHATVIEWHELKKLPREGAYLSAEQRTAYEGTGFGQYASHDELSDEQKAEQWFYALPIAEHDGPMLHYRVCPCQKIINEFIYESHYEHRNMIFEEQYRDMEKDETNQKHAPLGVIDWGQQAPQDLPILSVLFFVTDGAIFAKAEINHPKLIYGLRGWNEDGIATWQTVTFDQIRSDVQAWVESLEGERPVPRKERILTDGAVGVDAWQVITQWTSQRIDGPVVHDLEQYFGKEIPVHEPTRYTANWEQIHPFDIRNSPRWMELSIAFDTYSHGVCRQVDRVIKELKSKSQGFQVFKLTVTEEK